MRVESQLDMSTYLGRTHTPSKQKMKKAAGLYRQPF